jgi:ParB/RepB/Spo0J family partition protein
MKTITGTLHNAVLIADLEIESLKQPSWTLRPISEEVVSELMRSIQDTGLLQPILVQKYEEGYRVVFGNHRLEACRRLGMKRISAIISDFSDEEAFLAQVTENLLKNTRIDPIEEAKGYKILLKKGWTINAIARRIGKCDSYICERLALLDRLDPVLFSRVARSDCRLTPSHAELLSRVPDKARQNELARLVERKGLSVRALEDLLNGIPPPTKVQVGLTVGGYHLRIPDEFAKAMNLTAGQFVHMQMHGTNLVVKKACRANSNNRAAKTALLPVDQVSESSMPNSA